MRSLSWQQFEQLIADLFRRDGMVVEERGRASPSTGHGDGGVDLVLSDPNTPGAHYLVQCKQYLAWDVGEPKVREFYGAMAAWRTRCEGIFVTCERYTQPAHDFAADKPIRLIDGEGLLRWLNRVNPLAPEADLVAPATVRAVSHAAPSPSQDLPSDTSPHCPRCGQPMVERIARRGARQGQAFWGAEATRAATASSTSAADAGDGFGCQFERCCRGRRGGRLCDARGFGDKASGIEPSVPLASPMTWRV